MPAIPFHIIATILREPEDTASHLNKIQGIHFFQSETLVVQELFTYIMTEQSVSEPLFRSLSKILYSHNRAHYSNLPFDEHDLLTDVFMHKLNSANRNMGLACPVDWHSRAPEVWYNWLKVSLQNQLRDILRAPKNNPQKSLDAPVFEDTTMTLMDLVIDETADLDPLEAAEIEKHIAMFDRLQSTFAVHMPRMPDLRRLCWLLLKAPDLVTEDHFLNAKSQYSRSVDDVYQIWLNELVDYKEIQTHDDQQQTRSRAFLTWLLFGPQYNTPEEFQQKDNRIFNACRDNLRQNVTRATSNIHYQLLPYWIWLSHSNSYQRLWAAFLKQSLSLAAIQNQNNTGKRPTYNESQIYKLLFILQENMNGQPILDTDFLKFCSIILPDYCTIKERKEHTPQFISKYRRIKTRFIDCYNQLPQSLQSQISIQNL